MMTGRQQKKQRRFFCTLTVFSLLLGMVLGTFSIAFASAQIDFSENALQCRVTQRGSGDCAIASLATVEAYMNGLTGDSQAAYDTIWNKNGQQNYIQSWTNLGYRTFSFDGDFGGDLDAFCQKIYEQLEAGVPCLVRRNSSPTHYSVIVGYSGDPSSFELEDFTILEVNGATSTEKALMDLDYWMHVSGGTRLNQLVIRQSGAGEISEESRDPDRPVGEPDITVSGHTQPERVHKLGAFCPIKGKISSENLLASVEAGVWTSSGTPVFLRTITPNSRTYDLAGVNNDMAISKLEQGDYVYSVTAVDSTGYSSVLISAPFTVSAPNSAGALPSTDAPSSASGSNSAFESGFSPNTLISLQINNPTMYVNGLPCPIDSSGTAPIIHNDHTLLPVRAVMEAMGASIRWDDPQQIITIALDGKELNLQINNGQAWDSAGNYYALDSAPIIRNERTMLPIRFVAEYFGGTVEWSGADQMIAIAYLE